MCLSSAQSLQRSQRLDKEKETNPSQIITKQNMVYNKHIKYICSYKKNYPSPPRVSVNVKRKANVHAQFFLSILRPVKRMWCFCFLRLFYIPHEKITYKHNITQLRDLSGSWQFLYKFNCPLYIATRRDVSI